MAAVDEVCADLTAEGDAVDALVAGIEPAQWELPTPAPGWTIAHQVAHLTSTAHMAALAAAGPDGEGPRELPTAEPGRDFDAGIEAGLQEYLDGDFSQRLGRWRAARAALAAVLPTVPPGRKVPWIVTDMSPASLGTVGIMELFGHGQDIADALGVRREPTDRIQHLVRFGVRTRDFAYLARGLTPPEGEFRVELIAPSGALWAYGPEDAAGKVTGPAADFCLLVTRRRHREDLSLTASGPEADHWLDIAQAYAGPPGPGRSPGQFSS
jgi:enediyne biosynthesis protein E11